MLFANGIAHINTYMSLKAEKSKSKPLPKKGGREREPSTLRAAVVKRAHVM